MASSTLSQRPKITSVKEQDLLLVSQKQPNDSFLTCSMEAKEIMGKSAYASWVENKTTIENYYTDNNTYQIYQSINNNNPPAINQFLNTYNLGDSYNTYVDNKLYNNSTNLNEYINNNNYQSQLFQYKLQNVTEATNLKSFVTSNTNILNQYANYFAEQKSFNVQYMKEFVNQNNFSQQYETYVVDNVFNTLQHYSSFVNSSNLRNQFNTYITNNAPNSLSKLQEFVTVNNLTNQYEAYIINNKSNFLSKLQEFIVVNNLTSEFDSYVLNNDSGDTVTNYNNFIDSTSRRDSYNSFIIATSTIDYYNDFIDSSNNRDSYNTYVLANTTVQDYINFIENTNNNVNYITYAVNNSTAQHYADFIDNVSDYNQYTTWLKASPIIYNYRDLNEFVTLNNYTSQYNQFISNQNNTQILKTDETSLLYNFIKHINEVNEYKAFVDQKNIIITVQEFLQQLKGDEFYENYLKNNTISLQDFTELLNIQESYQNWVQEQLLLLKEDQFLQDLKGVSGTGSVLNKYTEIWLSVSGIYVKPELDPNNPPDPQEEKPLKFGLFVVPERTFIKFDREHRMYSNVDDISISMKGPFKKQLLDGQFQEIPSYVVSSRDTVASFEPQMYPEDVVILEAGSVVEFSFLNEPEPENMTTATLTIMARKVRSYSSSVNALRLQGFWGFKDSILGDATIIKPNQEIVKGYWADIDYIFKDWAWYYNETKATRSFKDVYACTVQTAGIEHIVSFNNTSKTRRVLTLTPFQSLDPSRLGMFVGDKNKLPVNCILKENGELEITLEGWED